VKQHIVTKHGDRCLVLRPGTREGAPALVRRERDSAEFEVYYNDLARTAAQASSMAFYGAESKCDELLVRAVRAMRTIRARWQWRNVPIDSGQPTEVQS
jgi:hypothetical protein